MVQFFKVGEIDTLKEQFNADVIVKAKWREPTFDGQQTTVVNIYFLILSTRVKFSFLHFASLVTNQNVERTDWHYSWDEVLIKCSNANGYAFQNNILAPMHTLKAGKINKLNTIQRGCSGAQYICSMFVFCRYVWSVLVEKPRIFIRDLKNTLCSTW